MKIFCIPHAGAPANVYLPWKRALSGSSLQIHPLELAGKGKRTFEKPFESINEAAVDIYDKLFKEAQPGSYCLFGHSMGGLIAYELSKIIHKNNKRPPAHIFYSGLRPPNSKKKPRRRIHELNDAEFLKEIYMLGGLSDEILQQEGLRNIYLPVLRNDMKMVENYEDSKQPEMIDSNISVFCGKSDKLIDESVFYWHNYTKKICSIYLFEGGHFFFQSDEVLGTIEMILQKFK